MTKKEIIWREVLNQALTNKKIEFSQKELAQKFGFSLSTIFNALKIPRQIGAIQVGARGFRLQNTEKFLYLWATQRNLERDVIYTTNVALNPQEIESAMPPGIIFGCYSAFRRKYGKTPADYDKVYVYADAKDLSVIKKRFPPKKGYVNLIVISKDIYLGNEVSDVQIFVDIWNLKDWYAKEFLDALKNKLFH
jgi:AraC-like DNA-binding protein